MVDLAGIEVAWADDEDGPRLYLTVPERSLALTFEQAHDLHREVGGCLGEIRWHLARWVIVSGWGKKHLVRKDDYSETAQAICDHGPGWSTTWRSEYAVQQITSFDLRDLCRRCQKLYAANDNRED